MRPTVKPMPDWGSSDRPDFDRLGELLPARNTAADKTGRGAPGTPPGTVPPGTQAADELSQRLAVLWADVVGAEVAENARPVQLRDGRLVVTTSSSAWAQTLQFMGPMIVAGLNERLGEGAVEKAVFRHAGWDLFAPLVCGERKPGRRVRPQAAESQAAEPSIASGHDVPGGPPLGSRGGPDRPAPVPRAAPADPEGFSAEEKQALAELEQLPLPPSTKEIIREAMKAGFARAKQDNGRS